jgi:hypothetical protein
MGSVEFRISEDMLMVEVWGWVEGGGWAKACAGLGVLVVVW